MTARPKIVICGMGVQGHKRLAAAGEDTVATVDPMADGIDFTDMRDVPLDTYDAAVLCIPDEAKLDLIGYLLAEGKHVMVEKPMLAADETQLAGLVALAEDKGLVCYTAYNHRFEPHYVAMRDLLASGELGRIYSLRMFYGNGTARLVRDSAWRDQGAGVLPDLGSHLLDTLRFWFGDEFDPALRVTGAFRHENRAFDHVILGADGPPAVQLEMTMLSWRNHFTCDVYAENGSAHIESLCKWGPTTFIRRRRVLPSGRPPEDCRTLIQADPTWALEYEHFISLCQGGRPAHNLDTDIWLNRKLSDLAGQAGVDGLVTEAAQP